MTAIRSLPQPPSSAPAEPAIDAGDVIVGRYLVRERVGAGAMGIVYRAEDLVAREDVALRALGPALLPDDAARGRFLTAATAARALASRYVGGVRDVFGYDIEDLSVCVVVGDFLRRPTLAARVGPRLRRQSPLAPAEVAPIVSQLGVGLSAIHRAVLVHGNLKARNIFFAGDEIRIGDLGVAVPLAHATNGRRATAATDVRALAALTAELLGLRGAVPADDVPATVRATLARALSRNRRERFADVDALAGALLTAFERGDRTNPRALRPVTPPAEPRGARASHGEDSAFIAGALQVSSDPAPTVRQARPVGNERSVLLDPEALDSLTPVTAPPIVKVLPVATPPAVAAPAALPAPLPPPVRAGTVLAARPRMRVPMWLVLVLMLATTSLAMGMLHRLIDARFQEQVAVARVEKARVLARLRAETARAVAAAARQTARR